MCVFCVDVLLFCMFFFFKQKTAYEMRISDWSSDVCSSDLGHDDLSDPPDRPQGTQGIEPVHCLHLFDPQGVARMVDRPSEQTRDRDRRSGHALRPALCRLPASRLRLEERRGGKECVRTGRSGWAPGDVTKKNIIVTR